MSFLDGGFATREVLLGDLLDEGIPGATISALTDPFGIGGAALLTDEVGFLLHGGIITRY